MLKNSYNRKDYKTALPQLEKLIKELTEKVEKLEERVKELENNNA